SVTKDMNDEEVTDVMGELYFRRVQTLVPLRDSEFIVRPVDGIEVGGKRTAGVRIANKSWPSVNLYFDEESWLLVKVSGPFREAGSTTKREIIYSDFKNFDGLKLPTRFTETRSSVPLQEAIVEYSFPVKIDKKEFEGP